MEWLLNRPFRLYFCFPNSDHVMFPRDPWPLTPGAKEDMRGIGMVIFRGLLRARQQCCSIARGRLDICQESDQEIDTLGGWHVLHLHSEDIPVCMTKVKTFSSVILRPWGHPPGARCWKVPVIAEPKKLFRFHCRPKHRACPSRAAAESTWNYLNALWILTKDVPTIWRRLTEPH